MTITATQLLHDLTQLGYEVTFNSDFKGMLTITYKEEHGDYIRHQHLSYPDGPMAKLDNALRSSLENFIDEVKEGRVQRDGLAKLKNS